MTRMTNQQLLRLHMLGILGNVDPRPYSRTPHGLCPTTSRRVGYCLPTVTRSSNKQRNRILEQSFRLHRAGGILARTGSKFIANRNAAFIFARTSPGWNGPGRWIWPLQWQRSRGDDSAEISTRNHTKYSFKSSYICLDIVTKVEGTNARVPDT